ncbi:MAG: serine/threonine-protein kinase [Cyanobacteria bacterium P01_F01_bin.150]
MSYCINPWCAKRDNPEGRDRCQSCDTPLLVCDRYRLIRPLRELDEWEPSEIFEIEDLKTPLNSPLPRGETPAPSPYHSRSVSEGRREGWGGVTSTKVLKVLRKELLLPLFEREVLTLQQLDHPGIPQVQEDGYFSLEVNGAGNSVGNGVESEMRSLYCLVMENIQGVNLDMWLQDNGPIDQDTAVDWMGQIVDLLARLHKENLFHRDIKLSNIMLRPTGQLALIDFGTVRPMTNTYFVKVASQRDITSVVSPGYTPLEQMNGRAIPQSDFYALGRSFIYLLTGKHPIDLTEDDVTGRLIWRDETRQPIQEWFAQLLDDMTAPFPGQRPLNAEALLDRLTQQKQKSLTARQIIDQAWNPAQQLRLLVAANLALLVLQLFIGFEWSKSQQKINERINQRRQNPSGSIAQLSNQNDTSPIN